MLASTLQRQGKGTRRVGWAQHSMMKFSCSCSLIVAFKAWLLDTACMAGKMGQCIHSVEDLGAWRARLLFLVVAGI